MVVCNISYRANADKMFAANFLIFLALSVYFNWKVPSEKTKALDYDPFTDRVMNNVRIGSVVVCIILSAFYLIIAWLG